MHKKRAQEDNHLIEEQVKKIKEMWSASSLTVEKLAKVETAVIQFYQQEEFPEELIALQGETL